MKVKNFLNVMRPTRRYKVICNGLASLVDEANDVLRGIFTEIHEYVMEMISEIPTWDDMCALKDIFFDDEEEVYQIHPKKSEYVNLSENYLHLWKPIGHELGELVEKRYE